MFPDFIPRKDRAERYDIGNCLRISTAADCQGLQVFAGLLCINLAELLDQRSLFGDIKDRGDYAAKVFVNPASTNACSRIGAQSS